jgi:hypothetical protein
MMSEVMEDYKGITEVPYPHTNLFYSREVLEKIEPPWYTRKYSQDCIRRLNDMDFTFLDKVKAAGFPIYINTSVEVRHLVLEGVDTKLHNRWHRK